MKSIYRNLFFLLGLAAIVVMLITFEVSFDEVMTNLQTAGWWFAVILLLWFVLYAFHACTWRLLIRNSGNQPLSFARLYKITLTGFALNSATPCGLMGSEPYKIMELSPYIGGNRATSSVLLFAMMHIFSHFWFWLAAIVIYIVTKPVGVGMGVLLAVIATACLLAIYFFLVGYKKGLTLKLILFLARIPFLKQWANHFLEKQRDNLLQIDQQIAQLHNQRRMLFSLTLGIEFAARVISCLEIYIVLYVFQCDATFLDTILILAFTSLFANLLFIIPMQLGGREGGFAMSVGNLAIPASYGIIVSLICRLRELFFTVMGIALMKIGNNHSAVNQATKK